MHSFKGAPAGETERKGSCPPELPRLPGKQKMGRSMTAINSTAIAMTFQRRSTPKLCHTAPLASSFAGLDFTGSIYICSLCSCHAENFGFCFLPSPSPFPFPCPCPSPTKSSVPKGISAFADKDWRLEDGFWPLLSLPDQVVSGFLSWDHLYSWKSLTACVRITCLLCLCLYQPCFYTDSKHHMEGKKDC